MALTKPDQSIIDIEAGMKAGPALFISSGAITLSHKTHAVDTEAAAASDDLETINAGSIPDGALVMLYAADGAHTVVLKHAAGNIQMANGRDFALDDAHKSILLRRDGANFRDITARNDAPVLLDEQTASLSASLDFLTGITTEYDEYILKGFLRPELDDQQLGLQVTTDGGATYVVGYHFFGHYGRQNGSIINDFGSGGSEILIGDDGTDTKVGNASDAGIWFKARFLNTQSTTLPRLVHGACTYVSADGGLVTGTFGSLQGIGPRIDGFRMRFLSGSISSGDIKLFGT